MSEDREDERRDRNTVKPEATAIAVSARITAIRRRVLPRARSVLLRAGLQYLCSSRNLLGGSAKPLSHSVQFSRFSHLTLPTVTA